MAIYLFDNMSASDATAFTSADQLYFVTEAVTDVAVSDIPAGAFTTEAISLTVGTHTLLFHADQLAQASANGNLIFLSTQDTLGLGDSTANTVNVSSGQADHNAIAYGFAGDDLLIGGAANDHLYGGAGNDEIDGSSETTTGSGSSTVWTESDYLNGGAGNDLIFGGSGNDHIYGNDQSSTAGAADGDDSISAGNGNDYVNGNAGADTIHGDDGNDKLYGGAGNDIILGGNGNDYLQGNKGADTLDGGAGNDTVHGGADNDVLSATSGNDQLWGDNGDDILHSGTGFDTLAGGAGNDVFDFNTVGSGSIANLLTATTAAQHDQTTVIADFTHAGDTIDLAFVVSHVDVQNAGATFSNVDAAYTYAQQLLDASTGTHGTEVAAIQVGADTYLFYDHAGTATTIDSVVKLAGVTASTLDIHDFV